MIFCPDCGGIVASRFSIHVCKRIAPKHKKIDSWAGRKRKTRKRKPCLLCGQFHK